MKIDWKLIRRSFTSSLNEIEMNVLETWLNESEKHRRLYDEMKNFVFMREDYQLDTETKKRFKRDFEARLDKAYRRRHRRVWLKVVNYAAIVVLLLAVGILFWPEQLENSTEMSSIEHGKREAMLVLNDGEVVSLNASHVTLQEVDGVTIHSNDEMLVYVDTLNDNECELKNQLITPKGGEYVIMLTDGTKVWVNAQTEISYPVRFSKKERRVQLKGEAYFEVVKDAEKPFIVMTDGMEVKVYGTQFNMNTRHADRIQVTLVEGNVSVKPKDQQEIMLKPNQQAIFNKPTDVVTVENVDVMPFVAWQRGNYYFENKSMGEILDELSLWYDIQFFFMDPNLEDEKFSGYLPRYEEIDKLLSLIEKTSHVHFEIKGRVIIVRK